MSEPSCLLRQARRQINLLERAMASSSCGITIADANLPDMPLIYVNAAFERITGYAANEVLGKNCRFLQGDQPETEARAKIRTAIASKEHLTVLVKNYRKDGTAFWNELVLSPIFDDNGAATHFVGIQTDVSERVEGKARIRAQRKQLEDAVQKLRTAHEEKDHLMALVAHDLRGPLASIRSLAEIVLMDDDSEDTEEMLRMVVDTADRSIELVSDLVDLSAVRSGKLKLKKEPVDLASFIDGFAKSAALRAQRKNIDLKIHRSLRRDTLQLDARRFNQALDNLYSNALKYSEANTRIEVRIEVTDREAIFSVSDQGKGIPERDIPHLFQPFRRAEVTPAEGESSTGLGLFIVKRLVELHGGTVRVKSREGQGSTFTISLPVEAPSPKAEPKEEG